VIQKIRNEKSNSKILQAREQPEYFQQPDNNNYYNNCIKNVFYGPLHGDIGVNEPKQDSCTDENNYNSKDWHINNYYFETELFVTKLRIGM
jgi:hypothetical protein